MAGVLLKQVALVIAAELGVYIAKQLQKALSQKIKTWTAF